MVSIDGTYGLQSSAFPMQHLIFQHDQYGYLLWFTFHGSISSQNYGVLGVIYSGVLLW